MQISSVNYTYNELVGLEELNIPSTEIDNLDSSKETTISVDISYTDKDGNNQSTSVTGLAATVR